MGNGRKEKRELFSEIMKRFAKSIICFDIFLEQSLEAALEIDVSTARENHPPPRLLKYSV